MNCKTHVDIKDAKIILPRIDKIWYYSHFTDEETEAERLGNLCKVTSLVNKRSYDSTPGGLAPDCSHNP